MNCKTCNNPLSSNASFCKKCGQTTSPSKPVEYFSISVQRLVLLSILTFSIYDIYWFYKNWKVIKESEKSTIYPIARAIFAIFYCHRFFKQVHSSVTNKGYTNDFSPGWLATGYIAALVLSNLLGRYETTNVLYNLLWLSISLSSIVFLVPIQKAINFYNEKVHGAVVKKGASRGEIAIIIIGIICTCLILIGLFLPEEYSPDSDTQTQMIQYEDPSLTKDPTWPTDYNEGYQSGYTDSLSEQPELLNNYKAPPGEEQGKSYAQGYMDGFRKGCEKEGFDCSNIKEDLFE